jgi:hypothetical protein
VTCVVYVEVYLQLIPTKPEDDIIPYTTCTTCVFVRSNFLVFRPSSAPDVTSDVNMRNVRFSVIDGIALIVCATLVMLIFHFCPFIRFEFTQIIRFPGFFSRFFGTKYCFFHKPWHFFSLFMFTTHIRTKKSMQFLVVFVVEK